MKIENNHIKGLDFLYLGLYAFAGLGSELLLSLFIEPLLYGKSINKFTSSENIAHWILTCIMWGIVATLLIYVSKKKYEFDIFANRNKIGKINWIIALILLGISIIISIWEWNGFKVLIEFKNNGWLKFVFQYIYYIFEAVLVLLIIVFGQKAGEIIFKNTKLPWGGFLLGLTWGLVHFLIKGNLVIGLILCLVSVLYGIAYLAVKKNVYVAYPLIFLMFVL
ncbi:hypothetical protein CLOACE_08500 [Clostridium acetireducens DSM 10703]|jgi:hypothetical protein|uniref:CAAX amino terminal protease self-immunity n=1 Tax=Clostridium acetireducens DSM 10703 TaxID=1121290 RepID=A0A1E8EZY1_9CLOT|nr:hypothetical protein [Clostridium acetireducens]OFI06695.1 hypothetical protein CLOACE_08500 [Clostridium acetireducens DSM 10703]